MPQKSTPYFFSSLMDVVSLCDFPKIGNLITEGINQVICIFNFGLHLGLGFIWVK